VIASGSSGDPKSGTGERGRQLCYQLFERVGVGPESPGEIACQSRRVPGPVRVFVRAGRVVVAGLLELVEIRQHDVVARGNVRGPVPTMANIRSDRREERVSRGDPLGRVAFDGRRRLPTVDLFGGEDAEAERHHPLFARALVFHARPLHSVRGLLTTSDLRPQLAPFAIRRPASAPATRDGGHSQDQMVAAAVTVARERVDRFACVGDRLPRHLPLTCARFDLGDNLGRDGRVEFFPIHGVSADSDDVLDALQAGAHGYLLKGASPEAIVEAVRAVHEGAAVIAPAVAPTVLREIRRTRDRHIRVAAGTSVSLTEREWKILQLLDQGESTTAIASELYVAPVTVRSHISALTRKLEVGGRAGAVALFRSQRPGRARAAASSVETKPTLPAER
jgi:DNA-binding CsgD family transcriptional regulator